MNHVLVCREYPPAPYPPGGIGTYVNHLSRLLAEAGESVHVVAQRWEGAPLKESASHGGRLVVHRVSLDEPAGRGRESAVAESGILKGLAASDCPSAAFSWQVARIVEHLVATEMIDVIEAPEWEAPLYWFQVRRALGLGPARRPPCIVHLHSPSELIFRHNQWDLTLTDYQPLRRLEEYTVTAADALLCPSRYLAAGARALFGLSDAPIHVIPYPLGDTPSIERSREVWERDSICFVGRLELRKGVLEWVDAAVETARSHPDATFEFIGSDTSLSGGVGGSVGDYLRKRIPRPLRRRFRFHATQPRARLLESLAQVSVAVAPSRWENLPYSCIEAMCTGLPVLASPNGGMAELVTDGQSGWVAPDGTASGLASALRRALETPAGPRAAMGRAAETAVRRHCGNQSVLERHLELRASLAAKPAKRSPRVPAASRSGGGSDGGPDPASLSPDRRGMGVVVTCLDRPDLLPGCLLSVVRQTRPAEMVVVVVDSSHRHELDPGLSRAIENWPVLYTSKSSLGAAREIGGERLLSVAPLLRGVAFVNEFARLEPPYLNAAESVLERQPGIGLISTLVRYDDPQDRMPRVIPLSWPPDRDEMPCVAVRTEAMLAGTSARDRWASVAYPDLLASAVPAAGDRSGPRKGVRKRYSAIALAQRGSARMTWHWFVAASLADKVRCVRGVLTEPRRAVRWIAWQMGTGARETS